MASRTGAGSPAPWASHPIGIGIQKLRGSNAVEVGHGVKEKLAADAGAAPRGTQRSTSAIDTTDFIENVDRRDPVHARPRGRPHRARLLVVSRLLVDDGQRCCLAIPTSILGTFIVMYFLGFTLNTFTVLGLTLVVGIVVDDAIMVLENIYRHREHGEGKVKAASAGARGDHLRRRRHHRRDHRDLPARCLHERHHRKVLLPVRRDDLRRGARSRSSRP